MGLRLGTVNLVSGSSSFPPQNLRFSKTIRYESRKQLAQQRPRVRGQFIKHGGPGGSGALLDDGVGTPSNGAKSCIGGADGIGGVDGGGEDEVQTNSRGYYEVGCGAMGKLYGVGGGGGPLPWQFAA